MPSSWLCPACVTYTRGKSGVFTVKATAPITRQDKDQWKCASGDLAGLKRKAANIHRRFVTLMASWYPLCVLGSPESHWKLGSTQSNGKGWGKFTQQFPSSCPSLFNFLAHSNIVINEDFFFFFLLEQSRKQGVCHLCRTRTKTRGGDRLCLCWEKKIMRVRKQTLTDSNIPTFNSFPKTVLSPSAEQFQRQFLNWNWHSLMPIWAPSPMTIMASGRLWQIIRCLGARPGILLQIMLAPRATTDEKPLLKEKG